MPSRFRAVYRLQLGRSVPFARASQVVPYVAQLGFSHLYLSPILESVSDHGYDVTDHTRVREALGGLDGFERFVGTAHHHGLGVLLDIVPNHMALGGHASGNSWWWDVLEHGRDSPHATAFDIDWERDGGVLLLPVLDDHLRRVVDQGRLTVERAADGALHLHFEGQRFPLCPASVDVLSTHARERGVDLGELVDEIARDPAELDRLVRMQHYRLARWQVANRELGYRRFFDVTELVALRVELPEVFDQTHGLIVDLVRRGLVDGLRVDHPDGLRDPEGYLRRLRDATGDIPIWVEKILAPGEVLPATWPTAGTTGYDFADLLNRSAVDTAGALALREAFVGSSGVDADFSREARAAKRQVLHELLATDVDRVAAIARTVLDVAGWDVSTREVRHALIELAVALPVYRTYIGPERPATRTDAQLLRAAAHDVTVRRPDLDADVVDALVDALLEPRSSAAHDLIARFQQLCSPAAAKGVEDTAGYRWAPVASLAEVGSLPDELGAGPAVLHDEVERSARHHPRRLLDTSTHDTKRSEDVRARIAALSEMADEWLESVATLDALGERHRAHRSRDRALELIALQTLVGAWPIDADRFVAWLIKAAREGKRRTSWTEPDHSFEQSLEKWARGVLADGDFVAEVDRVVTAVDPGGRATSLGWLTLKLTAPGVAGVYQGTEVFERSLVDPDNRRPVDFAANERLLARVRGLGAAQVWSRHQADGGLKLWLLDRLLAVRQRHGVALDGTASYAPLAVEGPAASHAIAFARGDQVAVVVTRLPLGLERAGGWRDTAVVLPDGSWRDTLADRGALRGPIRLDDVLRPLPVAVFEREG